MSKLSPVPTTPSPAPSSGSDMSALEIFIKRSRKEFVDWYARKFDDVDIEKMRESNTFGDQMAQIRHSFDLLGEDVVGLRFRFEDMNAYEHETINDLRDRGVSIGDLIDYIRAEPGFNPHGKPVRTDVATALRRKEFLEKSNRLESSGRSAALAAGAVAMVGLAAASAASGMLPGLSAAALWIPKAWTMVSSLVQTAAGGGAMLLAWKGWSQFNTLRQGSPKIDIGSDAQFADLPHSLGKINYAALNEQHQSIPVADLHLIKHLSPTETRMFFLGSDATRLHLLRANPPSAWSKIQARLTPVFNNQGNLTKQIWLATKTAITAPWNRDKNNARVPGLAQRMTQWRTFAQVNQDYATEEPTLPPTPPTP